MDKFRRRVLNRVLIVFLGLAGLGLSGCGQAPEPVVPVTRMSLALALPQHPTSALAFVAIDRRLFEKQGLDVRITSFPSGKRALDEGLFVGAADVAIASDPPVAIGAVKHPELRVVASILAGDSDNRVVARRDMGVGQPADLRGKPVATQSGSSVHFFLHQFLLEHGLGDTDVQLQFVKIEELPDALVSGRVAAIGGREPFISQCLKALGDRAIVFGAQGIYEQMELLVTTDKYLREHPEVFRAVLQALLEAEAWASGHPDEARAITARHLGVAAPELVRALPGYAMRVGLPQSLLVLLEDEARWALGARLVSGEPPDFLRVLAPEPLLQLAPQRVSLIR
jgi:sulfonate transport system substrate-binding protein